MRNLLKFKSGQKSVGIKSSTFYTGILQQINIYFNIQKSNESRNKLKEFILKWKEVKTENIDNKLSENIDKKLAENNSKVNLETKSIDNYENDSTDNCIKKFTKFCEKNDSFKENKNNKSSESSNIFSEKDSIEINLITNKTLKNTPERLKNKQIYFIEEIRQLILLEMRILTDKKSILKLKKLHLFVHLLQLHFLEESLFEKVNEFLNTNFKLSENDFIGNAIRGNFSHIIKMNPELNDGIEEFMSLRYSNEKIDKLIFKEIYKFPDYLIDIFSGEYFDKNSYENEMEYICYNLAYNNLENNFIKTENYKLIIKNNNYLSILNGNFENIPKESFFGLIFNILFSFNLLEIENSFEEVFLETVDLDVSTAVKFLPFSQNAEFFYNLLISKMDINNSKIGYLINFAFENKFQNSVIAEKYANYLQDSKEYSLLCRFLCQNKFCNFSYKKETLDFFIKNMNDFSNLISKEFLENNINLFIFEMSNLNNPNSKQLEFLINHDYFEKYREYILRAFLNIDDQNICIMALKKIIQAQKEGIEIDPSIKEGLLKKFV